MGFTHFFIGAAIGMLLITQIPMVQTAFDGALYWIDQQLNPDDIGNPVIIDVSPTFEKKGGGVGIRVPCESPNAIYNDEKMRCWNILYPENLDVNEKEENMRKEIEWQYQERL